MRRARGKLCIYLGMYILFFIIYVISKDAPSNIFINLALLASTILIIVGVEILSIR